MKVLYWPRRLECLIFDVDGTIYPWSKSYEGHQRQVELEALADFWETSIEETKQKLQAQEEELTKKMGRKPSAAEIIRSFGGLFHEWLVEIRKTRWQPELFLEPQPELAKKIGGLTVGYKIAFASSSPKEVVLKILEIVGLKGLNGKIPVFGGGDCPPKPLPNVYCQAAKTLGVKPENCLSIGDRIDFDAYPAMEIGMGAVVVQDVNDLMLVADRLLAESEDRYVSNWR